jgi:hypothetical protein
METEVTATDTAYEIENGAIVSIKKGCALDYSLMRSSQLCALLNVIQAPEFSQFPAETRGDCIWLAQSLSGEIKHLFEIVAADKK